MPGETALAIQSLVFGGVLQRFPNLKVSRLCCSQIRELFSQTFFTLLFCERAVEFKSLRCHRKSRENAGKNGCLCLRFPNSDSRKNVPPIRSLVLSILSSPTDGRTDSFSPSILPSSRNLFILGDFNCHHPLWDSRGTSDPCGEEVFDWVISSDLLPLNHPDIPTLLHRSSGSRSSPDISFAPCSLALSCFWEVLQDLVLITYQFFQTFLSLRSFAPTSVPLPSIFRKIAGMTLSSTLTLTVLLQRNTRLFLFPLLLLSLPLWH